MIGEVYLISIPLLIIGVALLIIAIILKENK